MRVNALAAITIVLALAILVALELPHESQRQELIYHPLPKPVNLLKVNIPANHSGRSVRRPGIIVHYKRPPIRKDIAGVIISFGEVRDFYLSGWLIQVKKINTKGFVTTYKAIATQKGNEAYLYRVAIEDFPFTGKRLFINPPVLLLICADGTEAEGDTCDDHSKPESVIGR